MVTAVERAGPHDPVRGVPPRRPGSRRRTSTIDSIRPDGLGGPLEVDARARDLRTGPAGEAIVEAEERLAIGFVPPGNEIASIIRVGPGAARDGRGDRDGDGLDRLVGRVIGGGFRKHVVDAMPHEVERRSLRYFLADDLVGALLVSGYALQHGGAIGRDQADAVRDHVRAAADICAGWHRDGTIFITLDGSGQVPTPLGPPATDLDGPGDPDAWHESGPLSPHAMRRRRRLDLNPTDELDIWEIDQHFRDSHVDADGIETVVHEYSVRGRVDATTSTLLACEATAQVLPWLECPGAVASAARIVGRPTSDLRTEIRVEFTGVTTCTHLNDMLRTLADVEALLPS